MMAAVAAVNNMGACAHNPRGNLWFNDETTYGHKLLMKMGWSKGKGLGKNEDGIKENLSVKFKNTNSGLGYKDDSYANVMKTEYESILKNLSANYSQKDNKQENKSCEPRTKVVKSRLRYPKLFFGKDVTKYSEKDMKSIFICSLSSKDNQEVLESSTSSQKPKSEVEFPKVAETYSSTLSISDYFAKKMEEKKNNGLLAETLIVPCQQQPLNSEITETDSFSTLPNKQKIKKRKRNSEINSDNESVRDLNFQHADVIEGADNFPISSRKMSSKNKRKFEVSTDGTDCIDNSGIKVECIVPNKKKQKLSEDLGNSVSEIENFEAGKILNTNSTPDENSKSEICKFDNSSVEVLANEGKISCQIELSSKRALQLKKKRKKLSNKKRNMFSNTNELSLDSSRRTNNHSSPKSAEEELSSNDVTCSKKKFKKLKFKKLKSCLKAKTGNYSMKNVSFNENVSYRIIDTDYESFTQLSDDCNAIQIDLTNEEIDSIDHDESESGDNTLNTQVTNSANQKCNDFDPDAEEIVLDEDLKESCSLSSLPLSESSCTEEQEIVLGEKEKDNCSLSSLPSPKSPHYNSWIESQRQALKMKMYKKMLKSIKKHKILKTSNLLSIKGYGNWGFE